MENKKGTTVLLTVIGIATLLVAVVGATFAYFTATITDANKDNTDVTITAANLGTVTFTHGDTIDLCDGDAIGDQTYPTCEIYPGATESKSFEIKSTGSTASAGVDYVATLTLDPFQFVAPVDAEGNTVEATKDITNIQYRVWTSNTAATDADGNAIPTAKPADEEGWIAIAPGTTSITLGKANLGENATDSWTLEIRLDEIGEAQNYDQGKSMVGKITVNPAEDAKYTVNGELYPAE